MADPHDPEAGGTQLPPSHLTPRTREGWIATVVYLAIFALAMPPVTHAVLDRPDTWVAGVPLFFAALLVIYSALIGVLVWALRKDL
jgi:hypothetical protein